MKKLNIKSFLINHTEKVVFGVIALFVLVAMTRGTEWSSQVRSPYELKEEIRKVKDRIESPENAWSDQASYKVVDFSDRAKRLLSRISTDRYLFSTPLYHPLNKVDEPRREPFYEPVQALMAKAALVTLNVRLESTSPVTTPDPKAASKEKESAPTGNDEFAARGTNASSPAGAMGPGAMANAVGGGGPLAIGKMFKTDAASTNEPGAATDASGGAKALAAGNTARGYRVVAVRGVFPLKQQLENYQKALHVSESEALSNFEIADFVLERQVAKAGSQPWKDSEWKPVSIESAFEVLQEASVQDPDDPVPIAMKDQVITMELPWKLIGFWDELATHPKIKDQLLGKEEIEHQNLLLDTLDETASESKLNDAPKPRRRGLASIQSDMKGLAQQIRGNADVRETMEKNLSRRGKDRGAGEFKKNFPNIPGAKVIDELISDKKNYLLFRYLDFDVQSGFAYRYRVRLMLRNPNFEIAPEKLGGADPNIANGAERPTPWSNISDVAVVQPTVEYFLENVGRDPYREEKLRVSEAYPVAQLSIFNYDTKYGTWITTNALKISNIGAFIGDDKIEEEKPKKPAKKKDDKGEERDEKKEPKKGAEKKNELKILDLALGGLVTKKYFFSTLDVLIDVEPDSEIEPEQHPELKFAMEKRPDRSSTVKLMEDVLVSTSLGELKTLDSLSQIAEKDRLNDRVRRERASYKDVEVKKPASTDPMAGNPNSRRSFRRRGGGGRGGR